MKNIFVYFFTLLTSVAYCQQAPDFTVTDSDGIVHRLYEDHLNQGQTVVLKLFFIACPPCNALAPWMQEKYEQWGEGQYDVEFIELSIQSFDSNADVAQYKIDKGLTFVGVGADGGSQAAASVYQSGQFGPYFGTPTLVIIAPDGTVHMGFSYDDFDDVLASTGATGNSGGGGGGGTNTEVTSYNISTTNNTNSAPSNVKYYLKPANADSPVYDILAITGGSLNFDYPSTNFPEIENPVIEIVVEGSIIDGSVNALDLLNMRKHILELEPFTTESQLLASDINSDGTINALDLLNLQRALLELIDVFPNDTPAWKTIPSIISLDPAIGQTIDLDVQLVKVGDVNG